MERSPAPDRMPIGRTATVLERGEWYNYRFNPPLNAFEFSLHQSYEELVTLSKSLFGNEELGGFRFAVPPPHLNGNAPVEDGSVGLLSPGDGMPKDYLVGLEIKKNVPQDKVLQMFNALRNAGIANITITTEKYSTEEIIRSLNPIEKLAIQALQISRQDPNLSVNASVIGHQSNPNVIHKMGFSIKDERGSEIGFISVPLSHMREDTSMTDALTQLEGALSRMYPELIRGAEIDL